jgi:hypothetical protein
LLDYCGCAWHWHKTGIPTDINIGQLLNVLDLDKAALSEARADKRRAIRASDQKALSKRSDE